VLPFELFTGGYDGADSLSTAFPESFVHACSGRDLYIVPEIDTLLENTVLFGMYLVCKFFAVTR